MRAACIAAVSFLTLAIGAGTARASAPLSISVVGNHFVNGAGQTVRLLGVDRPGTEYACEQGWGYSSGAIGTADASAIAGWYANAVRIPLNEDCWLGINGEPSGGLSAATYRATVESYVLDLNADGIYAILDLHWSAPGSMVADGQRAMPDGNSVAFWSSVATAFKNNAAVLFDAFSGSYSPANNGYGAYPVSWSCWENGGCTVPDAADGTTPNAGQTYKAVGMQQLVNAIRATGATQPILLGGLAYANDLGGWLANEPRDPDGQLVASFHTYNADPCASVTCWNAQVAPVAANVPVVTGEFDEGDCSTTFDNSYMSWADAHGVSYLAWGWFVLSPTPCSSLYLVSNPSGAPASPNGVALHAHLLAVAEPHDSAVPQIGGTAATGQTLSCSPGSWTGVSPLSYAYQWLRDGQPISGARSSAYTVATADQGHSLSCQVTASNSAGSASATSAAVSVPKPAPLSIAVVGNHFVNGSGQTIRLLGVDRPGTEYACEQGWGYSSGAENAADAAAIAAWHADAVRIPLNEDCWLGINGQPSGGLTVSGYRQTVASYVSDLNSDGIYAILDLHWSAPGTAIADGQRSMPDDHSQAFWTSVAATFADNPAVVFDAFNEPYSPAADGFSAYPVSWSCWKQGGCTVPDAADGTTPTAGQTYTAVGMQQMVNAIRGAGAGQPILLGGLSYANDLSGWLANEPADPDHQLAASFHNYDGEACGTQTCWNSSIAPAAAAVPVVTGEFDEGDCSDSFDNAYMSWADAHGVSYLAWGWFVLSPATCSSLYLVTNSSGTPASPNGVALHTHLLSLAKPG